MEPDFWADVDQLVATSPVVIDRPKDTPHPKYPQYIYPLDYGYLKGTTSIDAGGIDVWVGSLADRSVVGFLCTVDSWKRDMEVKLLIGCSQTEIASVTAFFAAMNMGHTLVLRERRDD